MQPSASSANLVAPASILSLFSMVCDKVRIRFRKGGDLRLVSHHDLMRCFERMLRRAALPYHTTQGFHPKPRLVFALALPLGVIGCEEVLELELDEQLPLDDIYSRLTQHTPPGVEILSIVRIGVKTTAQVDSMCYRIALSPGIVSTAESAIASVLSQTECLVKRIKPAGRTVDIRPYIRSLRVEGGYLDIKLWVTSKGTARPEEVLGLLGLEQLTAEGAVLERTQLALHDELDCLAEIGQDS
ncbi:MAG: TIGR03936 family radical SAM-associated protein [Gemmataceae bacterium]